MNIKRKNGKYIFASVAVAFAGALMLGLSGCGGGGSDIVAAATSVPLAPPVAPVTAAKVKVPVTVIDGAIGNATVCLDKNINGICDAGEPTGKTDAAGNVTLEIDAADAGKFPILAVVGTDAVDADNGPVKTAFTLQAPADQPAVVSPLTTLVQSLITTSGATSASAEASVKQQLGLNVSLFQDFTKSTSVDSQTAATVARLVVVTTQQQSTGLSSTVGTTALDGTVITQADLDRLIQNRLLQILPALVTTLTNLPAGATQADLLSAANALVADPSTGLTTTSVATLVAINNQTISTAPVVADAPAAGAILRAINFTNASNWSVRVFVSTLAQATPDVNGLIRFVQRRYNAVAGQIAAWTTIGGSPNRQSDLHFNGTAWVGCALNTEDVGSVRDTNGNNTYNICDNYDAGSTNRASFDVSGKSMIDVYNQINAAGYANLTIANASTVLGSTAFPANSKLFYQASTSANTAVAYYPGSSNTVRQYSTAVAAGGVASSQPSGVGCNSSEFQKEGAESTTLESLINVMHGTPCDFTSNVAPSFVYQSVTYTSPELRNEAWGNSTVSIGTIGSAAVGSGTAPGYYTGNTRLRVAFTATNTNEVTYYSCKERFSNGSTRNCDPIGTGTYTISTQGDARILTLSNTPQIAIGLGFQRVFVERAGKLYFGYKNNLGVFNTARLNLPATNALLTQLGLPTVDVDTPLALTKTSYAGEYRLIPSNNPSAYVSLFLNRNGSSSSTYTDQFGSTGPSRATTITFTNLATGEFTLLSPTISGDVTGVGSINFLTGQVTANINDPTSTPQNVSLAGARR